MKTILVLFSNAWDRFEFSRQDYEGKYRFVFYGGDLFKFPGSLKLLKLDIHNLIERIVSQFKDKKVDGVLSTDEYIGVIVAALVAKRLGLPGADPEKVIAVQHKFYARKIQQKVVPSATPNFTLIPHDSDGPCRLELGFPIFIKPVKGTYSILARKVENFGELKQHLRMGPLERFMYRRIIKPFNDLLLSNTPFQINANHFLGEELIEGVQVTVDGFAYYGAVHILGIVDSIMYPRTRAFQRFEYPSRLPASVLERFAEVAHRFMRGMRFDYGQFNIEMCYNPEIDDIKIIEVNPRLSYQFADLYEKVDGCNTYDVLISLSLGMKPLVDQGKGKYRNAASFVLRTFEGRKLKSSPSRDHLRRLHEQLQDARLMLYGREGQSLSREMRMVGSYRYAVINIGAGSHRDLLDQFQTVRDQLPFYFV